MGLREDIQKAKGGILVSDKGKQTLITSSRQYSERIRRKKQPKKDSKIQIKESRTGKVFTGRVAEDKKILAVRTVSKQEQRIREVRSQQEFYTMDSRQKSSKERAEAVAEKFVLRKGIGQGSLATIRAPITQELKFKKIEQPPREPTKAEKTAQFLTSPVSFEKVPVLKKMETNMQRVLAGTYAISKYKAEQMKTSKSPIVRAYGKASSFGADLVFKDYTPAAYDTMKTPSTHIISFGFNIVGAAASPIVSKFPAVRKAGNIIIGTAYSTYQGVQIATGKKTYGGVLGETVGYGVSSTFTKPLAQATVKAPQVVYTKVKSGIEHYKAQYQFNKVYKDYGGAPYMQSEGVYKQRTLTSQSISDKQLSGILAHQNRNKIGFGIERNTLRPAQNTFMSSGQQRLAQDKIIAVDIRGKFHKVKIVDRQPYVYNQRLGKYTEFVSGKYKLYTLTPNVKPLFSVSYKPSSSQAALTDYGFKPPVTPRKKVINLDSNIMNLGKPEAPKEIKIFSTSGAPAIRLDVKQTGLFSKTQYTTPPLTIDTTPIQTNIPLGKGKTLEFIAPAFSFKPNIKARSDLKISQDVGFKPKVTPLSKPVSLIGSDISSGSRVDIAQDIKLDTGAVTKQKLDTLNVSSSFSSYSSLVSPPSYTPSFPVETPIQPPLILPSGFALFGGRSKGIAKNFKINVTQGKGFKPSVRAATFNLKGITPKGSIITGIGERFVKKKKKKK